MADFVDPNALVTTGWLAESLEKPGIRVVESTWFLPNVKRSGRAEFEESHIPGAVFWDIDAIAAPGDPRPHMLPSADDFARHMADLGIGDGTQVIVYDRSGMATAARVWWMLRVFGHDAVSILDGGFGKWAREGRPTEAGPGLAVAAPSPFTPRPRPHMVRDVEQIRANIETAAEQVLDARTAGRFTGSEPEPRPGCRAGHVPGSMNLPYGELIDPESGTVRPAEALCEAFRDSGIDVGKPVVTTCGSGVSACMLAFGLHLLGHDRVAVYDGSWSEWGMRQDTPVEP